MNHLENLIELIESKEACIGVIGLGYVGLPVATMFAQVGFAVTGVDILPARIDTINRGQCPIEGDEPGLAELLAEVVAGKKLQATTDYNALAHCHIVLINVQTPVDDQHIPRYEALKSACRQLGAVMNAGTLVIVESTIAPGTMDKVVRPILEETSGQTINQDFYLGACPERVMPGKLLHNLRTLSRVCGGSTPETAETMVKLYRHIVQADLDTTNMVTASLVKTTENTYRDVQIAFANEVALICEAVGADVWRVRELVNKVPSRQMHYPGAGVGGHCIPKDPWLLAHASHEQAPLRLIPAARSVNESMPHHMLTLTQKALQEAGLSLQGSKIAVLGYAYLENSDDTRNSPSAVLVPALQAQGAKVVVHDPWVAEYQGDVWACVAGCQVVVVMVAHHEYKQLDMTRLVAVMDTPILIDGRHVFDQILAQDAGIVYWGVGQGLR